MKTLDADFFFNQNIHEQVRFKYGILCDIVISRERSCDVTATYEKNRM